MDFYPRKLIYVMMMILSKGKGQLTATGVLPCYMGDRNDLVSILFDLMLVSTKCYMIGGVKTGSGYHFLAGYQHASKTN